MLKTTCAVLAAAFRDLGRSWKELATADLAWRAAAFAALTPATLLLFRWVVSRQGEGVVADAEIAAVLLTTAPGILALVLGGAVLAGITALEVTGLLAIGFAAAEGRRLDARRAVFFAVSRAPRVLLLTAHMLLRVLLGVLPFAAGGGLVTFVLLRSHDINFYLSRKPPAFWAAAALVGLLAAAFAFVLVRTVARWAFALPIVLFEDVPPPERPRGEPPTVDR